MGPLRFRHDLPGGREESGRKGKKRPKVVIEIYPLKPSFFTLPGLFPSFPPRSQTGGDRVLLGFHPVLNGFARKKPSREERREGLILKVSEIFHSGEDSPHFLPTSLRISRVGPWVG